MVGRRLFWVTTDPPGSRVRGRNDSLGWQPRKGKCLIFFITSFNYKVTAQLRMPLA